MNAIINHQESVTKDKPGSAAEPLLFLNLALVCFTGIASPYRTRRLTDPAVAVPKDPGFGSCIRCTHLSFLATRHQAIRSQAGRNGHRYAGARKQQLGGSGLQAETPREAPSEAETRHLLFNNAVALPARKILPTGGHQRAKPL